MFVYVAKKQTENICFVKKRQSPKK